MIPTLIFDIETVPDTDGLKTLLDLPAEVAAEDVANIAFHQRRQKNGTDFLPLHQHRVVAISCALRERDSFKVWPPGRSEEHTPELQSLMRISYAVFCLKHKQPHIMK